MRESKKKKKRAHSKPAEWTLFSWAKQLESDVVHLDLVGYATLVGFEPEGLLSRILFQSGLDMEHIKKNQVFVDEVKNHIDYDDFADEEFSYGEEQLNTALAIYALVFTDPARRYLECRIKDDKLIVTGMFSVDGHRIDQHSIGMAQATLELQDVGMTRADASNKELVVSDHQDMLAFAYHKGLSTKLILPSIKYDWGWLPQLAKKHGGELLDVECVPSIGDTIIVPQSVIASKRESNADCKIFTYGEGKISHEEEHQSKEDDDGLGAWERTVMIKKDSRAYDRKRIECHWKVIYTSGDTNNLIVCQNEDNDILEFKVDDRITGLSSKQIIIL